MKKQKKRNYFWILVLIGSGLILLLLIVSAAISIGEKLNKIHPYVEYGFYFIYILLAYFLIFNPIRIILFAPTFAAVTTQENNNFKHNKVYRQVARNIIKNELIPEEQIKDLKKSMKEKESLRLTLNNVFDQTIKKDISKIIIKNATSAMVSTAISQNGKFDMLAVLYVNIKMIKEIVQSCGFRPSYPKLGKLSVNVITTALIANSLEGLNLDDLFPKANFIETIPLIKPVISSIIQGISNALLTLRIGYITRRYLLTEVKETTKDEIRKEAIKESVTTLPIVIKDSLSFIPKKISDLFTKKEAKET